MNLKKKKMLAAKALNIGKERIVFVEANLEDVKEAITKQDIRGLKEDGTILIREKQGKKKNISKKRKRGAGKVRKKVSKRKSEYVAMTRKLRRHVKGLRIQGKISQNEAKDIRKKIKNKYFKSLSSLKEYVGGKK